MLSVVIPIHNEEPSILPLYDRLTAVLEVIQKPYEIIAVDDASTDRSFDLLAMYSDLGGACFPTSHRFWIGSSIL